MKPDYLKNRRWLIITLSISQPNGYTKIDYKIPAGISAIRGVCFTTTLAKARGEVSFVFPQTGFAPFLRQLVPSQANAKRKIKLISTHIPVQANLAVQGYFKDHSPAFTPYKVNIYLDCQSHE